MGHLVLLVEHAYGLEHLFDALLAFVLVLPAGCFQDEFHVLLHGAVMEQLETLEDDSHLASQSRYVLTAQFQQVSSECFCFLGFFDVEFAISGFQQR